MCSTQYPCLLGAEANVLLDRLSLLCSNSHQSNAEYIPRISHEGNAYINSSTVPWFDSAHHDTCTFPLCPASSISKKSCFVNFPPKNPTITLFGNPSIFVLKSRTIPLKNRRE